MAGMPRNRLVFIGIIAAVLVGVGILILLNAKPSGTANAVTLTVWGTDPKPVFDAVAAAYSALRPNVHIAYTQVDPQNYNAALLQAFLAGQGPDVFMLGNHDVLKWRSVLYPATTTQISAVAVNQAFPQAVLDDLAPGGQIYALPLYMDTLSLVYNRDLLDQAGIAVPPATWQEVLSEIPQLKKINAQGQITTAAIALGGSENTVANATDIISLLMLQNGTQMTSADGRPFFGFGTGGQNASAALLFYLNFANPSTAAYTWNEAMGYSTDDFLSGKTAMILAYHDDLASFKARSPFLNYASAPVPQIATSSPVNFPRYQALGVWNRSRIPGWGWDFAIFATMDKTVNGAYLQATGRPPALRVLVPAAQANPDTGVYATESLTARSWLMPDYDKVKAIFSGAVLAALSGTETPDAALRDMQNQVDQLWQ